MHSDGMSDAQTLFLTSLTVEYAQLTQIGGRASNQDALAIARQGDLTCMVIADGIGSKHGGEVAANIVVQTVIARFQQELVFGAMALQSYIAAAATNLMQCQHAEPALKEMSATVAAILIDKKNRNMVFAHMGDTRIYGFRGKQLISMTKDHSLVQQFVDAGHCHIDQLRHHPKRSMLFAALGIESDIALEVTPVPINIAAGDALLMCTDGFWEWITEYDMMQTIASANSAQAWLNAMMQIVQNNGAAAPHSRDNCTAFTIFIDEVGLTTSRTILQE
ncbi:MAG: protein phosphatase 2C domain-containing protein [Glaciimonas sp.]|nr:protein phosphatase 2C domain-containing protein [Glaciimonas sp.]